MTTTAQTLQIIVSNVEDQDETGYTKGWIVPAGTDTSNDLEIEAIDHIDIPATDDETNWHQGLRDELAHAGYAIDGAITQDGATVTATVVRA